jgi:catechol 2,3-dioxygenase-like lactoylglutathione lyase family enzyme
MLGENDPIATVAVRDVKAARDFYEGKLGFALDENRDGALSYRAGKTKLFVYESKEAGNNTATAVTWYTRGKVDENVRELKAKGVKFEHYDMPNMRLEGDVHVSGEMRVAWFKDPDGNIHALVSD